MTKKKKQIFTKFRDFNVKKTTEKRRLTWSNRATIVCTYLRTTQAAQERGSQWGGGFYGYRLKFWLFYGYRLIFSVTVNEKVKN